MELTFRFLGSSIPVSGEFGEKQRLRAEPLGPVSRSKACMFCARGWMWVKSSSRAPRGWGRPYVGAQAHWLGAQP